MSAVVGQGTVTHLGQGSGVSHIMGGTHLSPPLHPTDPPPDVLLALLSRNKALEGKIRNILYRV